MDYGALVNKSLNIMWKYKYLWLLGFLVSLGQGTGHTFTNFRGKSDAIGHFLLQPGILVFLILCAGLIFVIFLVLYYIAHGGLIHCVNRINKNEPTTLGDGWRVGAKNFWRLLGIGILILFGIIGSFVVFGGPVVVAFLIHKVLGILSLLLFIPLFLIALAIIGFVDAYADRVCVIGGNGVIDSIREGWTIFRNSIGRSIVVGIISFVSGLVYALLFILVGLGLIANFLLAWAFAGLVPAIIFGLVIMLAYVVITEGIFNTYLSAFWTLSYLEIKKSTPNPIPHST